MDDVLAMAQADAEAEAPAPEDLLKRIEFYGEQQKKLLKQISDTEESLDSLKAKLRRVQEQDLPEAMDAANMKKFEFQNGGKTEVKTFYSASIPEERKDEAFTWLKDNDHEGIIKCTVTVSFDKKEFEIAQEFVEFIRGFNRKAIDPEYKENVHWQTMRAFVKEEIEGGKPLPLDLFGVFIGRKAELKLPKN